MASSRTQTEDGTEMEWRKPTLFSIINEKLENANKKNLLHRMVYISRLRTHAQSQDPNYVGNEYKKFFKDLQSALHSEAITGLLLIYHQHIVHIIETSSDMLLKIVKDLHQSEQDKFSIISKSKILGVTHDIPDRLYSQWSYRALDIEAMNLEQYEPSEETYKVVADMLIQVYRLGVYLHRKPSLNLKNVLDYLHDHVPEFLPQQAIIYFLLKDNDNSMMRPSEYIHIHTSPFDLNLESEFVWPVDTTL
ncbi:testis-expressed protein 47-like [Liolophura sinensis]|uniref:testis-expressed protein 47-like n=1 Tax=Liolophura sinensis TaxID=3198878 RepID=UPI0031584CE1